ncbi:MAG: hypothetical protein ABR875_03735 [Minisyncoccia bacterium]|jgi:uncharacterized protein YneF (UPF0154 family)
MTTGERIAKQLVVLVIILLIVGGIAYGAYFTFKKPAATPTPNPTINLTPVSVVSSQLINVDTNDYDFLAKVTNPNSDYGSDDVEYQIVFTGASGDQISTITSSFYILPGQTKYIINTPLKFNEPVAQAQMSIKSVDWQKMNSQSVNDISLLAKNISYAPSSNPGVFSTASGQIFNNSDYDLGQVLVLVILFDETNNPIAVNKTEELTFLSKTSRGFETSWHTSFPGKVNRTEVDAYTNVFQNSNFIATHGGTEKFQENY